MYINKDRQIIIIIIIETYLLCQCVSLSIEVLIEYKATVKLSLTSSFLCPETTHAAATAYDLSQASPAGCSIRPRLIQSYSPSKTYTKDQRTAARAVQNNEGIGHQC